MIDLYNRNLLIIQESLSGNSLQKIADEYNLSFWSVSEIIKKAGINHIGILQKDELAKKFCVLANPQMTNSQIVKRYKIGQDKVRKIRKDNNIVPPEKTTRYKLDNRTIKSPHGCWRWMGNRKTTGYGSANFAGEQTTRVHRLSWEIANGEIPDGMCVLHHCDNPLCVNPKHLYLGTHQDNARDRTLRGRRKGNKFKSYQVRAIRYMLKKGVEGKKIAKYYLVDPTYISQIKTGRTYKTIRKSVFAV